MRNIKLALEYDGTLYCGWQTQVNGPTVQATLEEAIGAVVGGEVKVYGSGRTDSGVHALSQVASFHTDSALACGKLRDAINAHLPEDITVLHAEDVAEDFHARYSARSKIYRYVVLNRAVRSALERHRCFFVRHSLDLERMRQVAKVFVGKHDFARFCTEASGNTQRTVMRLDISYSHDVIEIEIEADGFLYNMVRRIAGALLEAGRGKVTPADVKDLLERKTDLPGGPTLPPHGLYLVDVKY